MLLYAPDLAKFLPARASGRVASTCGGCCSLRCWGIALVLSAVAVGSVWHSFVLSPLKLEPVDLTGKVAVVTGSTSGIGMETARTLLAWNATVIMPARNKAKVRNVRAALRKSMAPGNKGKMVPLPCDMASFKSVRAFAKAARAHPVVRARGGIDILVLNAGMSGIDSLKATKDGVEMVYQVNHLAPFLLTRLLMPSLTGRARIVHVSSNMHYLGSLDMGAYGVEGRNLGGKARRGRAGGGQRGRGGSGGAPAVAPPRLSVESYCDTKLMNVLFSNALSRRLHSTGEAKARREAKKEGVVSVAVHPGFVVSDLDRDLPAGVRQVMTAVRRAVARSTAQGAVTQIAAATRPDLAQALNNRPEGVYLEDRCIMDGCKDCLFCEPEKGGGVEPHETARDVAAQDWLWETSSMIVGLPP
eukprot:g6184.t1